MRASLGSARARGRRRGAAATAAGANPRGDAQRRERHREADVTRRHTTSLPSFLATKLAHPSDSPRPGLTASGPRRGLGCAASVINEMNEQKAREFVEM